MTPALTLQPATNPQLSWLLLVRSIKRPLVLLAFSVMVLLATLPLTAVTANASAVQKQAASGLEDGTYAFGQTPEPGQANTTYMVLTVQSQQVVGAFYQVSSSFDCFQGHVTTTGLSLMVTNSYDDQAYPYALALEPSSVASQTAVTSSPHPNGFYPIPELSSLDQDILNVCQANQV